MFQRRTGVLYHLYRTTGNAEIHPDNPAHITLLQTWTQPRAGAGTGPYLPPAPGSRAARRQLDAAIANRGAAGEGTERRAWFREGLPTRRPVALNRLVAQGQLNDLGVRNTMRAAGLRFVRQLHWASHTKRKSLFSPSSCQLMLVVRLV
jgi:hypothetical protein